MVAVRPETNAMNVDRILETFNRHQAACLLIGGMNFLLRHGPVVTFDVDLWVEDTPENLQALAELQAEWGRSKDDWGPVAHKQAGWLQGQAVFCLTSPHGAIDIFCAVTGLDDWATCRARAQPGRTAAGVSFLGLADRDMLRSQLALPEAARNEDRIRALKRALGEAEDDRP